MNTEEKMILQGFKITLETLGLAVQELRMFLLANHRIDDIPEWVTLEKAVALKGGPTLGTYRTKYFL